MPEVAPPLFTYANQKRLLTEELIGSVMMHGLVVGGTDGGGPAGWLVVFCLMGVGDGCLWPE